MIGLALTYAVALGLLGIGVLALLAPRLSAQQYGIVLDDGRALASSARCATSPVPLLLLASAERRDLLALGVVASAAVAAVDFVVVSRDRPPACARASCTRAARRSAGGGRRRRERAVRVRMRAHTRWAWLLLLVFAAAPAHTAGVWTPPPGTTWQWQITGVVDESLDVEMYDIDLFDAAPAGIEIGEGSGVFTEQGQNAGCGRLHDRGIVVICYLRRARRSSGPTSVLSGGGARELVAAQGRALARRPRGGVAADRPDVGAL
jgi:hypothetical protein